jgi:peptidyl-prolyl cis-trans isomerase A (cyclophilin A)
MRLMAIAFTTLCLLVGMAAVAGAQDANPDIAKLSNPAQLNEKAPDKFQVKFDMSKGEFIVEVTRAWAPNGADRFYNLVKNGFYDNCRFFRVVSDFMIQFGINGDPKISSVWRSANIPDDPVKQSNNRGYITFATAGPNTRTTQVFINTNPQGNSFLDKDGFAPFGKVTKGMGVVDSIYSKYGDGPPQGKGPDQGRVQVEGNSYLQKSFPNLDYIKTATIVPPATK